MDLPAELTDADAETRAEAYEELSLEMNDEIAGAILALAAGDQSDEVRADAIVALGPVLQEWRSCFCSAAWKTNLDRCSTFPVVAGGWRAADEAL